MMLFAIIPSLILLYMNRDKWHWKNLGLTLMILFFIGVIWDQISIRAGIWYFSEDEVIGYLFGMPIEEYLFMIFVPLLVINVYFLVEKRGKSR
jgi:lycopene cyclase domain-containing protein